MGIVVVGAVGLVRHCARRDVDLTADYWLYPRLLARLIKCDGPVHNAVIRHGEGRLPQLLCALGYLIYAARAVKQGIFRMHM